MSASAAHHRAKTRHPGASFALEPVAIRSPSGHDRALLLNSPKGACPEAIAVDLEAEVIEYSRPRRRAVDRRRVEFGAASNRRVLHRRVLTSTREFCMRHILQISGPLTGLTALCDDGTVWAYDAGAKTWSAIPSVPGQPGTMEAEDAALQYDRMAIERQEREEQTRRERFHGKE